MNPAKRRHGTTIAARKLRRNETEAEWKLWAELRNRRLNGFKFSRQMPLGPYIADFICREKKLIIEVDGEHHGRTRNDEIRTRWLNHHGYSVLRFWNREVLRERRMVLETIWAALTGSLDRGNGSELRYSPAAPSSPRRGEGGPKGRVRGQA